MFGRWEGVNFTPALQCLHCLSDRKIAAARPLVSVFQLPRLAPFGLAGEIFEERRTWTFFQPFGGKSSAELKSKTKTLDLLGEEHDLGRLPALF